MLILSRLLGNILLKGIISKQYHGAKFPNHSHSGSICNRRSFQFPVGNEAINKLSLFLRLIPGWAATGVYVLHMMRNTFNRFSCYLNLPSISNLSDEEIRKAGCLPESILSRNNLAFLLK